MDSPGTSNRREFLRGQAAVKALSNLAQAAVGDAPQHDTGPSPQPYLVQMKRWAMACDFELYLNAGQYAEATEVGLQALDLVEALEAQLTVYRDSSEMVQINRSAAAGPVTVEPRLFALLAMAQVLNRETGGAYDITSGPLSKVWGFFRRAGGIPAEHDLQAALANVGGSRVELDPLSLTVRFSQPGVELNLGSIGKGYALDRCEELMTSAGIHDFLWHGGRSSVLARGSSGADRPDGGGWIVGVGDPLGGDRRLAEIRLSNRALATSGSSVQFFRYQGKRYGHILDPAHWLAG